MNKPKRTSIHQILAEQKEASSPITEEFSECGEIDPAAWAALGQPRALSTCTIAPTETGHKITLQVESDADLHSLTAWLLGCLESLPT